MRRRPTRLELVTLEDRTTPATALSPGTEGAFVQSLYSDALGRPGSAPEVAGWVGQLQSGRPADTVAAAFLTSPEHYGYRVAGFYQTLLHRPADPAGLQNFVGVLQHGGSEHAVLATLLGSAEYSSSHPTNADFVDHLYIDLLHRDPAPGEPNHHLGLLAAGRSRLEVARGFLNSPERARVEVNELFNDYLGRDADPASLASMAGAVAAGLVTLDQVAISIAASPEHLTQAASAPGRSAGQSASQDTAPPRVVGAISLGNTTVRVTFSEPMADAAANPANFFIVQTNVNSEVGFVAVTGAAFAAGSNNMAIDLTTASQNEVSYAVTAVNVTDRAGNPLAPASLSGLVRIDPTTATFPGTPPSGAGFVDSDGDGLSDNVEQRGWTVAVTLANGQVETRQVTSDPSNPDTDGDGLFDNEEKNLTLDPRAADTDGDQLTDYAEFNQLFSDPTRQDTDGDGLGDSSEFSFFHTSPNYADTDGDQIKDGDEVLGNRNPRVADLPRPEIDVGGINLQLNVHFTETNAQERRDLETQAISTTLTASQSNSYSRQHTAAVEAHLEAGYGNGEGTAGFFKAGGSLGYTFQYTHEWADAAEQNYQKSLTTDKEVTRGFTVEREVTGAVMQVAISLRNVSDLAYRVKNLQVTAFIQDPLDRTRLTPLATLVPDAEPAEGYTLGPLVADRGPFVFTNTTIVPKLVESLMANPSGLIFRISNYDIVDEAGRNFAFTGQQVVERTSQVILDFGGASSLRAQLGAPAGDDRPGDETEVFRVATSRGRAVADTNGDGKIDHAPRELFDAQGRSLGIDADGDGAVTPADDSYRGDTQVLFGDDGREVGTTLFQALAAAGLTRYDEATTPTANLSDAQILGSYATAVVGGRETVVRIRGVSNDPLHQKYWEVLTPTGIDRTTDLNDVILKANSPVSLNYVQDLDGDGLPADVEFFLGTSDSPLPFGAGDPTSTGSATNEAVTFAVDPGFVTGTNVRVAATGGGLVAGTDYYARDLGAGVYTFYDSAGHANAVPGTAGRVDLTGPVTARVFRVLKPDHSNPRTETVAFDPGRDPGFTTGTAVRVTATGGGLVADTDYYARNLGGGAYSFYDTAGHATGDDTAGRINLTDLVAGLFATAARGRDTDRDGLDDRFEALVGWTVTTPLRTYRVWSSPNRADSNADDPDAKDDPDDLYDGSDRFAAPAGWNDANGNGLRDRFNEVYQTGKDDYVLDPIRRDTDGDGINDAAEIIGFPVVSVTDPTGPATVYHTDPLNPDTDGDTVSDGYEMLFGLNPTNGSDFDTDGDGLPDPVEATGWHVLTTGVSSALFPDGVLADAVRTSKTNDADSDDDGLTDFEEFFLKTNPMSADTDGDGISDLKEVRGYALGHEVGGSNLGIITTDPLDADFDNDGRSDGAEAELANVEKARWVVRVQGAAPRRVYSNPLVADADFDGLADGAEFAAGTDPNDGNTDGDARDDGTEVAAHTNPLVEDFQVTVFFTSLKITSGQEADDNPGDYGFDFGVRKPDGSQSAGLGGYTSALRANAVLYNEFQSFLYDEESAVESALKNRDNPDPNDPLKNQQSLRNNGRLVYGINIGNGDTLRFPGLIPAGARSVSFGMTKTDSFAIEGVVAERDNGDGSTDRFVYLGGLEGVRATEGGKGDAIRPVFLGSDLVAATSHFHDLTFTFTSGDNIGGGNDAAIEGVVSLYFVVTGV